MELITITALVIGLTEVVKRTGYVPANLLSLVAVLFGSIIAYFFGGVAEPLVLGLQAGLGAIGLFEVGKNGVYKGLIKK